MGVDEQDLRHLERCLMLAEEAVDDGDEPFGSLRVAADGTVLFADRNRVKDGNGTRHPVLAIALWAADGPVPALAERVRALHARSHGRSEDS